MISVKYNLKDLIEAKKIVKKIEQEGMIPFSSPLVGSFRKEDFYRFHLLKDWELKLWIIGECNYASEFCFFYRKDNKIGVINSYYSHSSKDGIRVRVFNSLDELSKLFETSFFLFDGFDSNIEYDESANELIVDRVNYSEYFLKYI